ncbi:hypothetical protein OW763_13780 [Clostridium aestuarii]|uniref:Uncharacterized protein n=1 Tax=Clostridium aestuarii TaxID=338193 RepID=A0ABT4D2C4_9CLOT|nr:hypothetical protein [Clostridium aestuarii]MCY6485401.1 hypothetical protein [Clostridium aestuarii]
MKIKRIKYMKPLSTIEDIEDDTIDIFVTLEDEMTYTLTMTTPKQLIQDMDNENINYVHIFAPDIIVRSLTEENIREAVETFAKDDAYWLKFYYLVGETRGVFSIENLNKSVETIRKERCTR